MILIWTLEMFPYWLYYWTYLSNSRALGSVAKNDYCPCHSNAPNGNNCFKFCLVMSYCFLLIKYTAYLIVQVICQNITQVWETYYTPLWTTLHNIIQYNTFLDNVNRFSCDSNCCYHWGRCCGRGNNNFLLRVESL
jgi:hypothetical protein